MKTKRKVDLDDVVLPSPDLFNLIAVEVEGTGSNFSFRDDQDKLIIPDSRDSFPTDELNVGDVCVLVTHSNDIVGVINLSFLDKNHFLSYSEWNDTSLPAKIIRRSKVSLLSMPRTWMAFFIIGGFFLTGVFADTQSKSALFFFAVIISAVFLVHMLFTGWRWEQEFRKRSLVNEEIEKIKNEIKIE